MKFIKLPSGWGRRRSLLLLMVVIAVVALIAGTAVWYLTKRPAIEPADEPANIGVLPDDEVPSAFEQQTGVDWDDIKEGDITSQELPDYETADLATEALGQVGNYRQAAKAFAVAEEHGGESLDYKFYLDYSVAALKGGDTELALAKVDRAETLLKRSDLPQELKKQELRQIEMRRGAYGG